MSKPPVIICQAALADLAAVAALERATFTSHAISPRQMRYLQKSPAAIFLIARRFGELAGDAIALVRQHQGGRRSGRIYSLVVDPNHRGQKIGQKLMAALLRELARRGAKRIYLEVEESNHGAIRLYEQLGFKIVKPLHHYYGRGKHGVHMMKEEATPSR
ncbi:MAG TPA: N-acetyltransferase [Tepidisphaeraceae bacterium]|jgi:ribosomal-protein-alanine N-acetyltransferase|nr:N-acetyltransferase [Tepidisphaeraceae bacterium]